MVVGYIIRFCTILITRYALSQPCVYPTKGYNISVENIDKIYRDWKPKKKKKKSLCDQ